MAQAQSDDEDQEADRCRALTASGERCSRPAREDGFCYQHDEDDPTVDEAAADEEVEEGEADDESEADESADAGDEGGTVEAADDEAGTNETNETAEEGRETVEEGDSGADAEDTDGADDGPAAAGGTGVLEIRESVASVARDVIGRALDGVVEVNAQDDGWRAEVEVIERRAVPDTQDILGRYELLLDGDGEVQSYRRLDRYRRGDTAYEE